MVLRALGNSPEENRQKNSAETGFLLPVEQIQDYR